MLIPKTLEQLVEVSAGVRIRSQIVNSNLNWDLELGSVTDSGTNG